MQVKCFLDCATVLKVSGKMRELQEVELTLHVCHLYVMLSLQFYYREIDIDMDTHQFLKGRSFKL
jgi:hypothetical protein